MASIEAKHKNFRRIMEQVFGFPRENGYTRYFAGYRLKEQNIIFYVPITYVLLDLEPGVFVYYLN